MKVIVNQSSISSRCDYVLNRNHIRVLTITCTFVTIEITDVDIPMWYLEIFLLSTEKL